jgi:hypothetical protein
MDKFPHQVTYVGMHFSSLQKIKKYDIYLFLSLGGDDTPVLQ